MAQKLLFLFLVVFLVFVILNLYFVDKVYLLSPIGYTKDIIVRNDDLGEGHFDTRRRGGRRHGGIDLYAQIGTEVRAACFGRVQEAGFHRVLGNYVELIHPRGIATIYGHLKRLAVKSGQWVSQGQIIGYVGKSGNAKDRRILPHVHFEVRRNNIPINPAPLLYSQKEG